VAVETRGTVQMRGETTPGVEVEVLADGVRISLLHDDELIGDWEVGEIGIKSLHDGFAIRAEGEEFVLKTDDDVGIAREMGLVAASPRLARKLAASQSPEPPMAVHPGPVKVSPALGAIGFALGGVMTMAGGFLLRGDAAGGAYWSVLVLAGLLMLGVAISIARKVSWARIAAMAVVAALVVVFALAAQGGTPDADHLLAYGLVAGGVIIGIAIVFVGTFRESD
jgi:hypothetical protein